MLWSQRATSSVDPVTEWWVRKWEIPDARCVEHVHVGAGWLEPVNRVVARRTRARGEELFFFVLLNMGKISNKNRRSRVFMCMHAASVSGFARSADSSVISTDSINRCLGYRNLPRICPCSHRLWWRCLYIGLNRAVVAGIFRPRQPTARSEESQDQPR